MSQRLTWLISEAFHLDIPSVMSHILKWVMSHDELARWHQTRSLVTRLHSRIHHSGHIGWACMNRRRFVIDVWAGVHFLPFLAGRQTAYQPEWKTPETYNNPWTEFAAHCFAQAITQWSLANQRRFHQRCLGCCLRRHWLTRPFCKLGLYCPFAILLG